MTESLSTDAITETTSSIPSYQTSTAYDYSISQHSVTDDLIAGTSTYSSIYAESDNMKDEDETETIKTTTEPSNFSNIASTENDESETETISSSPSLIEIKLDDDITTEKIENNKQYLQDISGDETITTRKQNDKIDDVSENESTTTAFKYLSADLEEVTDKETLEPATEFTGHGKLYCENI